MLKDLWIGQIVRKVYNSFYKEVEIQMKNIMPRLQNKKSDDISLGKYKNNEVLVKNGRYGPYLNYNGKNINLKYILQKKEDKSLTINDVKNVIDYPMNLGKHDKKEVTIHIGPYGKYMKYNGKNIKIPQKDNYKLEDCIVYIK